MLIYLQNHMMKIVTTRRVLAIVFPLFLASLSVHAKEVTTIEWVDLIPPADLEILSNPPKSITDIPHGQGFPELPSAFPSENELDLLSNAITNAIGDAATSAAIATPTVPSPEEQAYNAALNSTNVNAEFNKKRIRLPGFVVPVEYNDDQVITEFF